jgi:hypothetical protein
VITGGAADTPTRYPRAIGRRPLTTLNEVAEELARLYRAVAAGKVAASDGTKLAFMLSTLARTIEAAKIEPAIEALEQRRQQAFGR